jgi:Domain of unknown function (DUF4349)
MTTRRILLLVPALLLLTACAGTSGGESGGASSGVAVSPRPATSLGALRGRNSDSFAGDHAKGAAARPPALQRAVISTGDLTLRSRDVAAARARVLALVDTWGGLVADEQASSSSRGVLTRTDLTLRVPSGRFGTAMARLAGVAHVVHQERSSEDVTTQVIDVDARVRAKQLSVDRIEALLARAKSLAQILAIESDLSDRQAELDSLKQQQAWLDDQTSLSTIHVALVRSHHHGPAPVRHHGFLAGLATGWAALGTAAAGLLTGVGLVLPFAVLALLVGVPVWWLVRRRRTPAPAAAAEG